MKNDAGGADFSEGTAQTLTPQRPAGCANASRQCFSNKLRTQRFRHGWKTKYQTCGDGQRCVLTIGAANSFPQNGYFGHASINVWTSLAWPVAAPASSEYRAAHSPNTTVAVAAY